LPVEKINATELRLAAKLSGIIALRMLGLFLILPVFMVLADEMPGFTPQLGGLAVGIYGLTQALLQQPFGWLSDRWGRRPVLLLGLSLFAAGGIVAALADSMQMLIAGRALQGCGAIAGVAMAFAADFTHPDRRPMIMAIIGIGIGAAFLLSTMLSVPLANLLGLQGLFLLTAAFGVFGILLALTTPGKHSQPAEEDGQSAAKFKSIWTLAVGVFLLHAAMTLLFVVLPGLMISRYGFELAQHWKLYVPTMIASIVLVLPLLRRIGTTGSEQVYLPWAFFALAVSTAVMTMQLSLLGLGVAIVLYFFSFNLLESAMPAVVARLSGSQGRGRRMGVYSTFQFLGAFAGGVTGGWMLGQYGSSTALLVASLACFAWAVAMKSLTTRFFLTRDTG
jgi:MFS family permease